METAQVWTVIGLLAATLLGLLTVFGGGLNALRSDMQGMKADLRSFGGDLRDNTRQLAELTVKVGSLDTSVGSLDTRVGALETGVGLLENKVEGHDRRFDSLEEQISAQGSVLGDAIYGLAEQFREHLRLHAS